MATLEIGKWYWIPDSKECFIPGEFIECSGQTAKFRVEDNKIEIRPLKDINLISSMDTQCLDANIHNLIGLHNLSENAVLHNLRARFKCGNIYTFVSSILIAINPFRVMGIYDNATMDVYRNSKNQSTLPPHIFVTAGNAYNAMAQRLTSQSVVISGESGAGKTESIKLIMKYIARLSQAMNSSVKNINDQIIQANPVMEAFGNAKTSRNNNSSRFGKLITIRFSHGVIEEAFIVSYLLEKCRVVTHQPGERSYHVFYQVLAECQENKALAKELHLENFDTFTYASKRDVNSIPGTNDKAGFSEVCSAMQGLGISDDVRRLVFRAVAGVLIIGNIEFDTLTTLGDSASTISHAGLGLLEPIHDLLGFDINEMKRCLTSRNFGKRSVVTVLYTVAQSLNARDAFAKKIYSLIFDWLISGINNSLKSSKSVPSNVYIALLDIFGFEAFENNSFEQLLINYCNEKLQFHFNNYIFLMELCEYDKEGVDIEIISYVDNKLILDLLELKSIGLISMIDEELSVPRGTDETLLNKIFKVHAKHPCLKRAKGNAKYYSQTFIVSHYAGDVAYIITDFLEKDKDTLTSDLFSIGACSDVVFISKLFLDTCEPASLPNKKTTSSASASALGNQFKMQLNELIDTLNETEPHFVRCMKSNMEKVGDNYDSKVMLTQLRYSGVIEVCKIRQNGFPNRLTFEKFLNTYWILNSALKTAAELVLYLESIGTLNSSHYYIGHSKIFLKYEAGKTLDTERYNAMNSCATRCQKRIRGWVQRRRFANWVKIQVALKRAIATRNLNTLRELLKDVKRMPHEGITVEVVRAGISILARMDEENEITSKIQSAISSCVVEEIESSLKALRAMNPPFNCPLSKEATSLLQQIRSGKIASASKAVASEGGDVNGTAENNLSSASPSLQNHGKLGMTTLSSKSHAQRNPSPPPPPSKFEPSGSGRIQSLSPAPPKKEIFAVKSTVGGKINSVQDTFNVRKQAGELIGKMGMGPMKELSRKESWTELLPPEAPVRAPRVSVLRRQLSREEFDDLSKLNNAVEDFMKLCASESGITDADLDAFEREISLNSKTDATVQEASNIMLIREEVVKGRKQLKLQNELLAVSIRTPMWKIKNLLHQASLLGITNFNGTQQAGEILVALSQKK